MLGNQKLHDASIPVEENEIEVLLPVIQDLHDTLMDFKSKYGAGRSIAAPQLGIFKRMIYMFIDEPIIFINLELVITDYDKMEV